VVIEKTIDSLIAQTDRSFSVLLSDNHSKEGMDRLGRATSRLTLAGISVHSIRPPVELGRVEHWNWAHFMADADWVKPLFAGDWLDEHYVAKLRKITREHPQCRYVYTGFVYHRQGEPDLIFINDWIRKYEGTHEMARIVMNYGMQFGPPSAAAYCRTTFLGTGGYPTQLPICSDSLLFCTLASRYESRGIPEALCHFNIHGSRFSTTLPSKRLQTFRECLVYYVMLAYFLSTENIRYSRWGFLKLMLREARSYMAN